MEVQTEHGPLTHDHARKYLRMGGEGARQQLEFLTVKTI